MLLASVYLGLAWVSAAISSEFLLLQQAPPVYLLLLPSLVLLLLSDPMNVLPLPFPVAMEFVIWAHQAADGSAAAGDRGQWMSLVSTEEGSREPVS